MEIAHTIVPFYVFVSGITLNQCAVVICPAYSKSLKTMFYLGAQRSVSGIAHKSCTFFIVVIQIYILADQLAQFMFKSSSI